MSESFIRASGCFTAADILIPCEKDLPRWAVIACDQFTSQPEYWDQVRQITDGVLSAYHLILPECDLSADVKERIRKIHHNMLGCLQDDLLRKFDNCFLYTERSLQSGQTRCGLIGKVDLEQYDYSGQIDSEVRATEKTIPERIPPRMGIRRGAALELPHILLLCDDDRQQLIEPLRKKKNNLPKVYDFDLMLNGGHVAGWLIQGEEKCMLEQRIAAYEQYEQEKHIAAKLLYAVGDGNHSLATAKACYEELKERLPEEEYLTHPARYALCELNNIHDPCQFFEPIHRIVKKCNAGKLIQDLSDQFSSAGGAEIPWMSGSSRGVLHISDHSGQLPLSQLQEALESWVGSNGGELDYIHGEENLMELTAEPDTAGFLLPTVDKDSLFPGILSGGVLPRKTFSMGEAEEKRYYLEARRIIP